MGAPVRHGGISWTDSLALFVFAGLLLFALHNANEWIARRTGTRWLVLVLKERNRIRRRREVLSGELAAQLPSSARLARTGLAMWLIAIPVGWTWAKTAPLWHWLLPGEWCNAAVMFPIAFCLLAGLNMLAWSAAEAVRDWLDRRREAKRARRRRAGAKVKHRKPTATVDLPGRCPEPAGLAALDHADVQQVKHGSGAAP